MARRNITMNEHLEMIYQWHQGRSLRQISKSLHLARKTIRKYLKQLQAKGISRDRPLPPETDLCALVASVRKPARFEQPRQEELEPYRTQIRDWLKERHMTIQQVQRLLQENHQVKTSYMSLHRYVSGHFPDFWEAKKPTTVRLHPPPGQAQVDFGYAGLLGDPETGRPRKAWAFIMVLSYSRHRFVRFVFSQDSEMWIDCHIRAFTFFDRVPTTIVLDNLRDGVLKPDLYDPTLNRAYAEAERHFGFIADPAKVRACRHKGKVERQVPVVRQQLIAGRRYHDIQAANERALLWCKEEIGQREHGTTHRKPYEVFRAEEVDALKPLPDQPFERADWQRCTVHQDCHLIFQKCYYSVPHVYRDRPFWVRADAKLVRVYLDHELIKTPVRVRRPGSWQTDLNDYPPDKRVFLEQTPEWCRSRAAELGADVSDFIARILTNSAMRSIRKAQGVLRLAEKYGALALNQACRRALAYEALDYRTLKNILELGLWKEPAEATSAPGPAPATYRFVRPADYFVATRKELTP